MAPARPTSRYPRKTAPSNAPLLIAGAVVNFMFLIILLVFSYLREEPSFWMNANAWSAWPSGMRELVQTLYYPLLLLEFLLLSAFSGISIHLLSTRYTSASLAVVLLPMLWGLFFMVIVNSVFNNLENLWYGRPLHWHPHDPWPQGLQIPREQPAMIASPAAFARRGSHAV